MRGLVWFKKDLRLRDNPALAAACKICQDGVIAVYVIDHEMWKKCNIIRQISFILQNVLALKEELKKINISLLIVDVKQTQDIPKILHAIAEKNSLNTFFFNQEYEVYEKKRDESVISWLEKNNIAVHSFDDQLILPANLIQNQQDSYFKVFSAFKKKWLQVFSQQEHKIIPIPKQLTLLIPVKSVTEFNIETAKLNWPSGEAIAQKKLATFVVDDLFQYDQARDFPALDQTSHLSPYLALGIISGKNCFLAALRNNDQELYSGNKGALTWMSELIWREFYRHILIAVPHVCMNKAYKLQTDKLPWSYDKNLLEAWQRGRTGFPIVDAAMRQLNETGWMHNRLRMVVAMFLSKNLFLDWRLGEKYFAEQLIDFDFASNNGGWQWSASTGTDAVPYFRIFNPATQSERFDERGTFLRKFCPELSGFDDKSIHDPYRFAPLMAKQAGYERPIIDYKQSRVNAINAFKSLR